jgi:hypothetical protein
MTTQMGADTAPTTISRWEAIASRTVVDGRLQLAPAVGLGRRSFTIDSEDQTRTPDSGYNYVIVGANARVPLGSRIALRTNVAFEPVISGTEPTEAAFGEASRWAFDVGAAVEVRAGGPLVVRAAADYQRFSWSWAGAGERGAGGAVDAYPSATLAVGAEY